jgi:hypothetical protein
MPRRETSLPRIPLVTSQFGFHGTTWDGTVCRSPSQSLSCRAFDRIAALDVERIIEVGAGRDSWPRGPISGGVKAMLPTSQGLPKHSSIDLAGRTAKASRALAMSGNEGRRIAPGRQ